MKESRKAGLETYVLRNRERMVLIKPSGNLLILNKIRFHDEIRDASEIIIPNANLKQSEMKMAVPLIEQLKADFDISRSKDTYTEKLLEPTKAKSKGKSPATSQMKFVHSRSRDLIAELKGSLNPAKKAL